MDCPLMEVLLYSLNTKHRTENMIYYTTSVPQNTYTVHADLPVSRHVNAIMISQGYPKPLHINSSLKVSMLCLETFIS